VRKPVITDNDVAQPDNTAINQRDQSPSAVLPTDQGNSQQDIELSAEIRQRILRNKELSVDARNVKVITRDGNVTLRGPVASSAERDLVQRIARDVAGPDHVSDLLEITKTR
jgi:osmotically-inducible protein OsmY